MHSRRMRTARPLPCGGLPNRAPLNRDHPGQRPPGQRPPWTKTPLDKDPPGHRSPPGQRPSWTQIPAWTQTPLLDRDPSPGHRPPSHATCGACWDRICRYDLAAISCVTMEMNYKHEIQSSSFEFSRNTQSWQCCQLSISSNANKLETVNSLISFKANLHYS